MQFVDVVCLVLVGAILYVGGLLVAWLTSLGGSERGAR